MDILEYLRLKCRTNNITAYKLSKISKVSPTYCYRLMRGEMNNPSVKILKKIEDALTLYLNVKNKK